MNYENYKQYLKAELERRKEINEMYSLRSFAKDLEMSAPRLGQILSGKSGLSCKAAEYLVNKLKLDDKNGEWFLNSVGAEHSRGSKNRQKYRKRFQEIRESFPGF